MSKNIKNCQKSTVLEFFLKKKNKIVNFSDFYQITVFAPLLQNEAIFIHLIQIIKVNLLFIIGWNIWRRIWMHLLSNWNISKTNETICHTDWMFSLFFNEWRTFQSFSLYLQHKDLTMERNMIKMKVKDPKIDWKWNILPLHNN
jgi:hypothetical protein